MDQCKRKVSAVLKFLREFWIVILAAPLSYYIFIKLLPEQLFKDPCSTVVFDRTGELMGARIAADGQWRFPARDSIPDKYKEALLLFEDKYFYYHPGVNPLSLLRAAWQNLMAGEIVSGGSTLTMQVMRMSRGNKPRRLSQKVIEIILSLSCELSRSKEEILSAYANHAPFGGNVVGIDAAAWRYFGTGPENLTWAEAALLAVLPNAPSLINPGRNREKLKMKRDRLLSDLLETGKIDSIDYQLAIQEKLPDNPLPLPNLAPHLTDRIMMEEENKRFYSSLDYSLQERVIELTSIRQEVLKANEIHNIACLLMEIETGKVLAYVGNAGESTGEHAHSVDIITSERSTGSILKPLLFAGMIDNGSMLQTALVPDVPVRYDGYAPKNYNRNYEGAVPAYKVLERSLNIPSVILLRRYGVDPFLNLLKKLGFTTFRESQEHYGLTLILGGAETTLWELAGVYASMARVLNHYNASEGNYFPEDYHMPVLQEAKEREQAGSIHEEGLLSAGSIYITLQSLLDVNRPDELSLWYLMSSSRKIAWKTGTSYGFRDAWAVGLCPEYLVAVWAGNADGEGRPGLTGLNAAAPLMFDIFSLLPESSWFEEPLDNLTEAVICRQSGYLAGPNCGEKDSMLVLQQGKASGVCPYHKLVHLDEEENFRVNSKCYPVDRIVSRSWFILPPLMEWYYKKNDPSYQKLPPLKDGCQDESIEAFEIVYPERNSHLLIPLELDGSPGRIVLEIAHREPNTRVFWHLDGEYLGETAKIHQLAVNIQPGDHILSVVDLHGNKKQVEFEVLGNKSANE